MTWLKAYFNGDAISYGKIGKKSEVSYSGETMLKISGDINSDHGLYLKGYVGDVYENNKWSSIRSDENFKKDWKALDATGVTTENWHTQLRNELGDEERSGEKRSGRPNIKDRNLGVWIWQLFGAQPSGRGI